MLTVGKFIKTVVVTLLIFAALVQVNDPDPLIWIFLYGSAAVILCLRPSNVRRISSGILFSISLLYAGFLGQRVLGRDIDWWGLFNEMEMKTTYIEESREFFGLLIICACLLPLLWRPQSHIAGISDL